jgi:hypothetical protein
VSARPLDIRTAFDLLHGHPRETCPHCHRPRHAQPCKEQLWYEARMGRTDEIDAARAAEERESARREDAEFVGASDGSVDWENS